MYGRVTPRMETLARLVELNMRLSDADEAAAYRKRIGAVTSGQPRRFSLRPGFGQRRKPPPEPCLPRRRGGQPRNMNAVKTGEHVGQSVRQASCGATRRMVAAARRLARFRERLLAIKAAVDMCKAAGIEVPAYDSAAVRRQLDEIMRSFWHPAIRAAWPQRADDAGANECEPTQRLTSVPREYRPEMAETAETRPERHPHYFHNISYTQNGSGSAGLGAGCFRQSPIAGNRSPRHPGDRLVAMRATSWRSASTRAGSPAIDSARCARFARRARRTASARGICPSLCGRVRRR